MLCALPEAIVKNALAVSMNLLGRFFIHRYRSHSQHGDAPASSCSQQLESPPIAFNIMQNLFPVPLLRSIGVVLAGLGQQTFHCFHVVVEQGDCPAAQALIDFAIFQPVFENAVSARFRGGFVDRGADEDYSGNT